jgi:hypothetical protein
MVDGAGRPHFLKDEGFLRDSAFVSHAARSGHWLYTALTKILHVNSCRNDDSGRRIAYCGDMKEIESEITVPFCADESYCLTWIR